jgi:hypothetical protein
MSHWKTHKPFCKAAKRAVELNTERARIEKEQTNSPQHGPGYYDYVPCMGCALTPQLCDFPEADASPATFNGDRRARRCAMCRDSAYVRVSAPVGSHRT